ncbi:MAG TPA: MBL fold metallo-hydrolase [Bryobacteraceae bacterium]|nr:MBL fold metallo-hydrolase [Bryobacteraceae bacterium]
MWKTIFLFTAATLSAQKTLDIYWIDAEGGAATLIVTPAGQSLLADTGNPGDRDAQRIYDVATKQAHLKKIDTVLITHFHSDHVGGVPALAKLIPIGGYVDHGDSVETQNPADAQRWEAYKAIATGHRISLGVDGEIKMKGVHIDIVSSNGNVLSKGGKANPYCASAVKKDPDPTENARSLGFKLTFGKFTFLDLGDLTWNKELELACPENHLGQVTLFQATHHGFYNDNSGAPAHVWALHPQVVIVNNGPRKGLGANAWETISKIPDLEDTWQVHLSLATDAAHNTDEKMIANAEATADCKGNFLKASISSDGKFTITNSRNGFSKTYTAR